MRTSAAPYESPKVAERAHPAIEQVQSRLGATQDSLAAAVNRIEGALSRAFGPTPDGAASDGRPMAPPSGAIALLNDQLDNIGHLLDRLTSAADSLDRLV